MLKIVFMGTPKFSVPILEALINKYEVIGVVTQPDKMVGRKKELVASPVKECALKYNIPVFQPIKIREDYQNIMDLKPDLIVTAAYGQIVGMKLLNCPRYRSINVHASLLPKYRGGAPIHKAVINGEKETGVTIMYMEKQMDAGDILAQKKIPIETFDTTGSMFDKLSYLGRDLIIETIDKLIKNEITPIKQDENLVTFAYNISKEEEEINPNQTALEVFNHIRGLNPSPIAHIKLGRETLKIYESKLTEYSHNLEPGKLFIKDKNHIMLACGNQTVLELLTVQPVGKKPMSAKDFANGGLKKFL